MSVRLHLLHRWYQARSRRAHRRFVEFRDKAEKYLQLLIGGQQ